MSRLVRLGIRVRGDQAELALAGLLPLLPGGVEERALGDDVEYATYAPPGELPAAGELRARLGTALVSVGREPVPADWERRWHAFLRPATVREGGRSLTVRPPWLRGDAGDLIIDPGTCFGAGTHATTRLCLRLLLAEAPDGALCDWGAGSGVLAVAAARLGWAPVTALDVDPRAVAATAANAAVNGVAVTARVHDLAASAPPWAPTVCANLTAPLLRALAGTPAPERVVASGLLRADADGVAAAFAPHGLREARRLHEQEWAALLLVRA